MNVCTPSSTHLSFWAASGDWMSHSPVLTASHFATLFSPQSDATSSVSIKAWHGKLSILGTAITSWDASIGAPDERLEGRAFIAALSGESDSGGVHTSRMDVEDSEISYLGNEGDFHNDIGALLL